MARPVDLDELARLEEERDFLLKSIEDLDREHAAGDVDPEDYDELRRGYVARAAEAISALEQHHGDLASRQAEARPRLGRRLAWVGGCVAFAVIAGVLLAQVSGTRVSGDGLTGTVDAPGAAAERCRALSMQEPAEGIECYDEILANAPDDVDALTYQGWAYARLERFDEATERFDRVVELAPTFADVWVFIASVRNSQGDPQGAQEALDTLYSLNPAPIVLSTLRTMGLEREVALAVLDDDTRACWEQTEAANEGIGAAYGADGTREQLVAAVRTLSEATACFEAQVETHQGDADFLNLRSYTVGLMSRFDEELSELLLPTALASAQQALAARPEDPTALALVATWQNWLGDYDAALVALDGIGGRVLNPLVAPTIDVAALRTEIVASQSSPTTTAAPAGAGE